jgi:beta-lactamase regulating signal transducer with metallopeptidase domain
MNQFILWVASPEWSHAVRALLHTLWQGAIVALALAAVLWRVRDPVVRYRSSLAALGGLLLAGVVTWAILANSSQHGSSASATLPATPHGNGAVATTIIGTTTQTAQGANVPPQRPASAWTAWLALAWLLGAASMLVRAGVQVAGAGRLRRSSKPLTDSNVTALLAETQRAICLTRTVRLAVIDTLTSPAVVGVIVPTLILPLSLLSTLTPQQLRFVLLHELAHIRRGDYFASLFQLLVEALLFFNPAAWWISHQVRREREACCDATATALSGAPADYARTLVQVAESVVQPTSIAAATFSDEREPSSLAERVQRLLVVGYRPSLRLTWRAMLAALFAGGLLLFLSAAATRITVAAILSPQERIEKIERKLAEYGDLPRAGYATPARRIPVVARIRTPDGAPLPKKRIIIIHSSHGNSSGIYAANFRDDGFASNAVPPGYVWVEVDVDGFAPAFSRRFDATRTNAVDVGDLWLEPGFNLVLQVKDASTGVPVINALLRAQFESRETGNSLQRRHEVRTDATGRVTLPSCADHPLRIIVSTPGYEILEQRFEQVRAGEVLEAKLKHGAVLAGKVMDKANGQPIRGATVRVIHEKGDVEAHYQWTDSARVLAQSDASGRFTVTQLRRAQMYWFGVSAPGHESVIIEVPPQSSREMLVKLGPELIVRGRVMGSLEGLERVNKGFALYRSYSEVIGNSSHGDGEWVPLRVSTEGVTFEFTNRIAGPVTLTGKQRYEEKREVTTPVADWLVDLTQTNRTGGKLLAAHLPKREVIFRFTHPSGVAPRGVVAVTIPDNLDPKNRSAHTREIEITNGEVRAEIAIGGWTDVEPRHVAGYWFHSTIGSRLVVTNGAGPMLVEIPLLPAGAIYTRARNADGTPAGGLFFGVRELKPAPGRAEGSSFGGNNDSLSGSAPRKWASGPLPLGGVYEVYGWRGNSLAVSKPIELTESRPDAEVELQFPPGRSFHGKVLSPDGKPLRDTMLKVNFSLGGNHGFEFKPVATGSEGQFELKDTTPENGDYFVEVHSPQLMAERVKLAFGSQPQIIRLRRGHTLAGRVVESETSDLVQGVEVRAIDSAHYKLPAIRTRTDDEGRFEFTSLGDGEYTLYVEDGQIVGQHKFFPERGTNVTVAIKPYEWSRIKRKVAAKLN